MYQSQISFYIDVAKHFFELGESTYGTIIALNILEVMPDSLTMQRTVAYLLMQYEQFDAAINVLEKVDVTFSFQATSKRDLARAWEGRAKKTKQAADFDTALRYYYDAATKVDDSPNGLPLIALTEMNNLLSDAKLSETNVDWIPKKFVSQQNYDVRALLSWSNKLTDIDLHVLDPNGEDVYYRNRYSKIGGYLPYDDLSLIHI